MSTKEKILEALFWFFFIFGFVLLAWKIFGKSPLTDQIALVFIGGILTKLYAEMSNTNKKLARLEGRFDSENTNIKERLIKIEEKLKG